MQKDEGLMPNYNTLQAGGTVTAIQPGDSITLFNAEAPAAGQASISFATGYSPGGGPAHAITFTIDYAAAPTAVMVIQGSNRDIDADYQTLYTSTSIQHDSYSDGGGYAYYRAKQISESGGQPVTVIAQR